MKNSSGTPSLSLPHSLTHLAHEVVREVGRQHLRHELRPELVGVRGHRGHHPGGDAEAVVNSGHGVKQGFLVLLEVLVVRSRQTLCVVGGGT